MEILAFIIFLAILVGIIALIIWSIINPLPCLIVKILLNIGRVILGIFIIVNHPLNDDNLSTIGLIILIITTGLLFLYGLGRSIFENDIRETGNIIIEPLENGYRLAAEKTGDTAIGNFITALFFTGLVAVGAFFFWGIVLGLPVVATFVTIIVLSIINVFKSIRIFQNDI